MISTAEIAAALEAAGAAVRESARTFAEESLPAFLTAARKIREETDDARR